MKLDLIKPSKRLDPAYFKQSLLREQMELFKKELQNTFNHIDEKQDEEYHKNVIADLFKNVYCKDKYLVNVNKKEDLVIRLGNNTTDDVGVLLEFKKPTEKRDMVSAGNANVKALQEVVLYYLRQTVDQDNHKITNLVVTNIYEWFIFDGVWFEKNIFRNAKLKKDYLAFKTSGHDTKYFYDTIAAKYLADFKENVPCTYFNLLDYKKNIEDDNPKNDDELIDLYKILSPEHLLNKKFVNDSNSLNTDFYNELLYIIGLEESAATTKKTIKRINEAERNAGSFIENTISILKTNKYFGYDKSDEIENQYYETALELCITWLNRILFLKLLESQLINYHKNSDADFSFLSPSKISEFDELQELFFDVLAEKIKDRKPEVVQKYKDIPYLNSSLFEQTELEAKATRISGLKDRLEIPIFKKSVLKKGAKEEIRPKTSLKYLLEFLDAYNFASESNAKIQEENKSIINASVLGLIFEKINGYKDGSFFTPGFITMYMCRETIRKAVVEKFKTNFPKCETITDFDELKDKIDYTNKEQRQEANKLINQIRIVDPAVGSGHFLVSALNEMIAIKSDLQILSFSNGDRVRGYTITLDNDELIIQNQETDQLFEYYLNKNNNLIPELQNLQECLFHEKQTIIENCLFGVDINPKSVMICQLRLWIELLKNAYYNKTFVKVLNFDKGEKEALSLQTLPNIDINIKTGNSLISKFAIKDNVFERITGFQKKLEEYKNWVSIYKNTNDKGAKNTLKNNLKRFKDEFKLADLRLTKLQNELRKLNGEFYDKYQTHQFFVKEPNEREDQEKEKLEAAINDKKLEIQTLKDNPIYANAFEWRFEFPEVLDDNGNFIGFDIVIGNPPYVNIQDIDWEFRRLYETLYKTATGRFDLYSLFIERGLMVQSKNSGLSYIIPGKFLNNKQFSYARKLICENKNVEVVKINDKVFDEAQVDSVIVSNFSNDLTEKIYTSYELNAITFSKISETKVSSIVENKEVIFKVEINDELDMFISKIQANTLKVKEIGGVKDGIVAGKIKDILFINEKENDDCKKLYFGKHLNRYFLAETDVWVNYRPKEMMEEEIIRQNGKRIGLWMRNKKVFEREKILYRKIGKEIIATYDEKGVYNEQTLHSCYISDKKFDTKYVLGLFNSNLFKFYYRKTNSQGGDIFPQVRISSVENMPIKIASKETQQPIISLVNQILSLKKENPKADTSELESEIDELVYKLYELTEEEIEVVKNS